jgi:hypothetical protein
MDRSSPLSYSGFSHLNLPAHAIMKTIRPILGIASILLLLSNLTAQGSAIADDSFESYEPAPGNSLVGQDGGGGWAGPWQAGTGNIADVVDTTSDPLTFTPPGGSLIHGGARAVEVQGTVNMVVATRAFATPLPDTLYVAYLVRTTAGVWDGFNTFSLHLSDSDSNTGSLNFGLRSGTDGESVANHFMVRTGTGGPVAGAAIGGHVQTGTTYYLVARLSKLDSAGSPSATFDRIEMWLNPGPDARETAPNGDARLQLTSGGLSTISHLLIRAAAMQGDDRAQLDELVVASDWPFELIPLPNIVNFSPAHRSLFVNPSAGIQFNVVSDDPVAQEDIGMVLNGLDVSGQLVVTGSPNSWNVSFTGLEANRLYHAEVSASSQAGLRTLTVQFDTLPSNSPTIEAEDFNFSGGQYFDNPTLCNTLGGEDRCYFDRVGVQGIDALKTGPRANIPFERLYRFGDAFAMDREEDVDTDYSSDLVRPRYAQAPPGAQGEIRDYDVTNIRAGDWLNYTRTFAEGTHDIYLRARSTTPQQVTLSRVTNPTSEAQTATALGVFRVPATGGTYALVPLTNVEGHPLPVSLSGVQTLRLTADAASQNLQLNFLIYLPSAEPPVPAFVSNLAPPDGSVNVAPNAPIRVEIVNSGTTVVPSSIALTVDGADVTASATTTVTTAGVTVNYAPAVLLPGPHTASVRFEDDASNLTTVEWAFTVTSVPVLPPAWAAPVGSGVTRGFNVRSAQTFDDTDLPRTLARAEDQLAVPPRVQVDYTGTDTPQHINYKERADIADQGYFTANNGFPDRVADRSEAALIAYDPNLPVEAHHNNFAVEAMIFLALDPGYVELGVNVNDSFRLTAGRAGSSAEDFPLLIGQYPGEGGATAEQPQFPANFIVTQAGVYAFRLVWVEYVGTSSVELHVKDAAGVSHLLNDDAAPILAYRARTAEPPDEPARIEIVIGTDGTLTLEWTGGGTLHSAPALNGTWAPVPGATSPYPITTPVGTRFYQLR